MSSYLSIAIHDAARNCSRDGATAVLTLRSGHQIVGTLQTPGPVDGAVTVHIRTENGGWATVLTEEIAAVESKRA